VETDVMESSGRRRRGGGGGVKELYLGEKGLRRA